MLHQRVNADNQVWRILLKRLRKSSANDCCVSLKVLREANELCEYPTYEKVCGQEERAHTRQGRATMRNANAKSRVP